MFGGIIFNVDGILYREGAHPSVGEIYFVADDGKHIWSADRKKHITMYDSRTDGRIEVSLDNAIIDDWRKFLVHRLVAEAWLPNAKGKAFVHHINGNYKDNGAINLIYVTRAEHAALERLLREGKRTGDMVEYYAYLVVVYSDNLPKDLNRQMIKREGE